MVEQTARLSFVCPWFSAEFQDLPPKLACDGGVYLGEWKFQKKKTRNLAKLVFKNT